MSRHRIAVVGEARADQNIVIDTIHRMCVEAVDWLEAELLEHQFEWITELSLNGPPLPLYWANIKRLADVVGINPRGYFLGQPGLLDARTARTAILLLERHVSDIKAIILIRDADKLRQRSRGIEQARIATSSVVCLIAVPNPERECWVISGFDPDGDAEKSRFAQLRQELGFNPNEKSHELTATSVDTAIKSPKRVLRMLSGGDWDRERVCWQNTPTALLDKRGKGNGLADFQEEVRQQIFPMFGQHRDRI